MLSTDQPNKTVPNYPKGPFGVFRILELIGWPFLKIFQLIAKICTFLPPKFAHTFLNTLIFIGEATVNLPLFILKTVYSFTFRLAKISVDGVRFPILTIRPGLIKSIAYLKSFKQTLPNIPSIKQVLTLIIVVASKAFFWPCYYIGRLTFEILVFPFRVIRRVISFDYTLITGKVRNLFVLPKITFPTFSLPSISLPTISLQRPRVLAHKKIRTKKKVKTTSKLSLIYKSVINRIVIYPLSIVKRWLIFLSKLPIKLLEGVLSHLKNISKKIAKFFLRATRFIIRSIFNLIKKLIYGLLHTLDLLGTLVLLPFKVISISLHLIKDKKFRKKELASFRKKLLKTKASLLLFKKNLLLALTFPFRTTWKKTRRSVKNCSTFISKDNDPFLIPFLFPIKTPRRALATLIILITMTTAFYNYMLRDLPSVHDLVKSKKTVSSRIYDRNGQLLYTIYNGNENRTLVKLTELPPYVAQASIAIEDKDFYKHHGLSIRGVIRAARHNILKVKAVEGGSTITQQLVKNALLSNERTVQRKVKELFLAFETEIIYSKNEILEMYLNEVPYGGPTYGIQEAARLYFGKQAKDLSLAEATLLAGLPAAPSTYSPHGLNKSYAKDRQTQVLKNMVSEGYIIQQDADKALKTELVYSPNLIAIKAPHFVMWVKDSLEQKYGKKTIEEGGLDIYTTLDLDLQEKAEKIVADNVALLEKPYWISNAAALVTEPKTGEVLAMVGSRNFFDDKIDGNVNVTIMPRQPGSSIKPVNYGYALAHGMTPTTIINDSPVTFKNAWESYSPVNYDGKYRGNVTLRQALAMSLNIPAVKVLASYGPDKMVELGYKMGIDSWKDLKRYGLSMTLGGVEVKMTELATAYGTIANMGIKKTLNPIKRIVDYKGTVLEDTTNGLAENGIVPNIFAKDAKQENPEQVIPQGVAYQLADILSDNKARLPAFGPYAKLEIPGHKVAVKTGTTDDKRDNWTIGFTPSRLVAVWVGNNNNSRMNPALTSGITGAAPIWNYIMSEILKDKPDEEFPRPSGMVEVEVCEVNGLLPCDRCPQKVKQFFVPGQEPTRKCYFPSPSDCAGKKAQLEKDGKKPEEIVKALAGCPLSAPKPN